MILMNAALMLATQAQPDGKDQALALLGIARSDQFSLGESFQEVLRAHGITNVISHVDIVESHPKYVFCNLDEYFGPSPKTLGNIQDLGSTLALPSGRLRNLLDDSVPISEWRPGSDVLSFTPKESLPADCALPRELQATLTLIRDQRAKPLVRRVDRITTASALSPQFALPISIEPEAKELRFGWTWDYRNAIDLRRIVMEVTFDSGNPVRIPIEIQVPWHCNPVDQPAVEGGCGAVVSVPWRVADRIAVLSSPACCVPSVQSLQNGDHLFSMLTSPAGLVPHRCESVMIGLFRPDDPGRWERRIPVIHYEAQLAAEGRQSLRGVFLPNEQWMILRNAESGRFRLVFPLRLPWGVTALRANGWIEVTQGLWQSSGPLFGEGWHLDGSTNPSIGDLQEEWISHWWE